MSSPASLGIGWNARLEPLPDIADVESLVLNKCIKHVTRIARANRFNEGALHAAVESGLLMQLCRVAYRKVDGGRVTDLMALEGEVPGPRSKSLPDFLMVPCYQTAIKKNPHSTDAQT